MKFVLCSLNLDWGKVKKNVFIGFGLFCMIAIFHTELLFAEKQVPLNLFNIGDSIGEGEAAYNDIGEFHHELVWSTGYDSFDQMPNISIYLTFNSKTRTSIPEIVFTPARLE